jgi:hypothetical protein
MKANHEADATSLTILLNELKSKFDQKLIQGETFEIAKEVYMQIKQIESKLNVINWQNPGDGRSK